MSKTINKNPNKILSKLFALRSNRFVLLTFIFIYFARFIFGQYDIIKYLIIPLKYYIDLPFVAIVGVLWVTFGPQIGNTIYILILIYFLYKLNKRLKKYDINVIKEKAELKQMEENNIKVNTIKEIELYPHGLEVNFVVGNKLFWAYSDLDSLEVNEHTTAKFTFIKKMLVTIYFGNIIKVIRKKL